MAQESGTGLKHHLGGTYMPLIDPGLLTEIVAMSSDLSMLLSAEGRVVSIMVNPQHPAFGTLDHWIGLPFQEIVNEESREKFVQRMKAVVKPGAKALTLEVNHTGSAIWEFPIRYAMQCVDTDGAMLLLGRDMRPIAEMQQQLVMAQMALERDYETQREMDTRYRVVMETTRDAVVLVSMTSGRIADINPVAATLLGASRQDLIGSAIAQEFEGRRRGEFLESLTSLASTDTVSPVDLVARRTQRRLRVVPRLFRAAGERFMLCRLEVPEKATAPVDEMTENLERLYHEGVDGMVFLDRDGVVTYANEAFLKLTDSTHLSNVKGRSFADFLARGAVDLRVLTDTARRSRQVRLFSTRLVNEFDGQVAVELSATYLGDRPSPGFAIVVRDASRTEYQRGPGLPRDEESMRSVLELVGSSTLKDIVTETTDVVEKMCIQSAVTLTRNNRLAAAEMLGLSRQSLYVKLRKFGLLSKDGD